MHAMRRIIIDHKKLTPALAESLLEKFPNGYGDEDLITFKTPGGEWVEAVELQTPEALYLVKISKRLSSLLFSLEESNGFTFNEIEKEYDGSLEGELNLED
jgi:hypothetical protein